MLVVEGLVVHLARHFQDVDSGAGGFPQQFSTMYDLAADASEVTRPG